MLAKLSVKKPLTVFVSIMVVIMLAVISFTKMPTDLLPSIDLPYIAVITTCPGASPEKVETTVTKPLEAGLSTTGGIEKITSVSSENYSMVLFQFSFGTNMDTAMIDMNNKINQVQAGFDEMTGTPTMMKINPDMLPVVVASVAMGDSSEEEISKIVKEIVLPEMEKISGVASVEASGLYEKQLILTLNQGKINDLNDRLLGTVDSALAEQRKQLEEGKTALQAARLEFENQKATQTQELIEKLTQLEITKTTLKSMEGSAEKLYQDLLKEQTKLKKDLKQLEELSNSPVPDALQQQAIETLRQTIARTDTAVAEAKKALDDYRKQLKELEHAESQLEEGKKLLNTKLAEADIQLKEKEAQLQQAETAFQAAADSAMKSLNLEGMLHATTLSTLIAAQNFSMPAGYADSGALQLIVKVGDAFANPDEISSLVLISTEIEGFEKITIADVADVAYEDNTDEIYAKVNGKNGILFTVSKQSTASTAEVSERIRAAVSKLEGKHEGMQITILNDQGVYIDIVVNSVISNLLMGGVLAILILFLFLRSIKPTVIVALSIPISLALAIVLMYFSNVSLNIISLAGLALGVGMLVDNSIVVIENIYRLRAEGVSAVQAAILGTKEVTAAITSSTLTTICVFLPIVFVEGISRELFTDMGLTIAYSLLASLLIAITLIPALSSGVLKKEMKIKRTWFDRIADGYGKLLKYSLKRKWIALGLALILMGVSVWSTTQMGTAFIPESDSSQISATVTPPEGCTAEETAQLLDEVSNRVQVIDGVETVGTMLESGSGSLYIILEKDRTESSQQIAQRISDAVADMECKVSVQGSAMNFSALGGSGVQIKIVGDDLVKLEQIADEIGQLISEVKGVQNVVAGSKESEYQLHISVYKEKAMQYGLTVAQVYQAVAQALSKQSTATTVEQNGTAVSVVIRKDKELFITEQNIAELELQGTKNNNTVTVTLGEIASITKEIGSNEINREDSKRYVSVTAGIEESYNIGLISREIEEKLATFTLPEGYRMVFGGENETINTTLRDLIWMVLIAIALVYLIMVAQFQSFSSPFIVLFTVPLAFTGGLLMLWACGFELSVISILGFLVLTGVVVNNGIVFVDCTNQLRQSGMERHDALVQTGRQRIRPILMTAMTTILGLLTLAFGIGEGTDMLQPMAVVIVGGLTYATLLTLFVVPALYDVFQRRPMKQVETEVAMLEQAGKI